MSELTEQLREKLDAATAADTARIKPSDATHSDLTFFLCIKDQYEEPIARKYIALKYPKTKGKVVPLLPLPRLTGEMVIIPLIRGDDRSPSVKTLMDASGRPYLDRRPWAALAHEVRECGPVHVKRFMRKAETDAFGAAFGGDLDYDAFCAELNQLVTPCTARAEIGRPLELLMAFT